MTEKETAERVSERKPYQGNLFLISDHNVSLSHSYQFGYRERFFISLLFLCDEISFRPTLMYAHRVTERNEKLN